MNICKLRTIAEDVGSVLSTPLQAIVPFGFEVLGKNYLSINSIKRIYVYLSPYAQPTAAHSQVESLFLERFIEVISLADPVFLRSIRYLVTPHQCIEVHDWSDDPMNARQISVEMVTSPVHVLDEYSRYMSITLGLLADWRAPECIRYEFSHRSRLRILQLFLIAYHLFRDYFEVCFDANIPLIEYALRDLLPVGYNLIHSSVCPPSALHSHVFDFIIRPGLSMLSSIFNARIHTGDFFRLYVAHGFHHRHHHSAYMDIDIYDTIYTAIRTSYISYC